MLEIVAAILTGLIPWLPSVGRFPHHWFIITVGAAWLAYIIWRVARDRAELARWGFRLEGLRPTLIATAVVAVVSVGLMALVIATLGMQYRLGLWHRDLVWMLLLYPLWGIMQQFLVQGLIAGNLVPYGSAPPFLRRVLAVTPVCAALFAAAHYPMWPLVGGTFVLGLAFTPIYLRWRNLWPLGLFHGWLAIPAFFWLMDRNPWQMSLI